MNAEKAVSLSFSMKNVPGGRGAKPGGANWQTRSIVLHYPTDKCQQKKLRYPLDSDLSGG